MTNPIIGPIDQQEIKPVYFLFSDEVGSANIQNATINVQLLQGSDVDPQAMKVGDPVVDNATKIVSQRISAPGRANNVYKLRCQVTDANSNVHVIAAQLSVVAL